MIGRQSQMHFKVLEKLMRMVGKILCILTITMRENQLLDRHIQWQAVVVGWMRWQKKTTMVGVCLMLVLLAIKVANKTLNPPNIVQASESMTASVPLTPSAPPIDGDSPIHYPSNDSSPVDWSVPSIENNAQASVTADSKDEGKSSSCILCWEAPVEGACIPCCHMAGCMKCLNEIKAKKGLCPVCCTNLNQVIRVYDV